MKLRETLLFALLLFSAYAANETAVNSTNVTSITALHWFKIWNAFVTQSSAGDEVYGKFEYQIWSRNACPTCLRQLIAVPEWNPKDYACCYEGVPGPYPGKAGVCEFKFKAPKSSGEYRILVKSGVHYSCDLLFREGWESGKYFTGPTEVLNITVLERTNESLEKNNTLLDENKRNGNLSANLPPSLMDLIYKVMIKEGLAAPGKYLYRGYRIINYPAKFTLFWSENNSIPRTVVAFGPYLIYLSADPDFVRVYDTRNETAYSIRIFGNRSWSLEGFSVYGLNSTTILLPSGERAVKAEILVKKGEESKINNESNAILLPSLGDIVKKIMEREGIKNYEVYRVEKVPSKFTLVWSENDLIPRGIVLFGKYLFYLANPDFVVIYDTVNETHFAVRIMKDLVWEGENLYLYRLNFSSGEKAVKIRFLLTSEKINEREKRTINKTKEMEKGEKISESEAFELLLKLENLKMKFSALASKTYAIAKYYERKGDEKKAKAWEYASSILSKAPDGIEEVERMIKESYKNGTYTREEIREELDHTVKEIISNVLKAIMGAI